MITCAGQCLYLPSASFLLSSSEFISPSSYRRRARRSVNDIAALDISIPPVILRMYIFFLLYSLLELRDRVLSLRAFSVLGLCTHRRGRRILTLLVLSDLRDLVAVGRDLVARTYRKSLQRVRVFRVTENAKCKMTKRKEREGERKQKRERERGGGILSKRRDRISHNTRYVCSSDTPACIVAARDSRSGTFSVTLVLPSGRINGSSMLKRIF